jgi:ATP-dependent 26S proteasome regulatory subunit
MAAKKKAPNIGLMLHDASVPFEHRKQLLLHLCHDESEESQTFLNALFETAANGHGEDAYAQKAKELNELIQQMQQGPLRYATFLQMMEGGGTVPRARVVLMDGTVAFPVVHDAGLAQSLRGGESVLLEAQARALLYRDAGENGTGEEARLERRIDTTHVEVAIRDERYLFRAADRLIDQLDRGEVEPGCHLLVCERRRMAFDAVPREDGLSHYRFLVKESPPDVLVERDIGAPPAFLDDITEHVRMEMLTPDLGRRYRLRQSVMKLLTGVSGSGKTLCVQALWRRMYEVMSAVTGVPVEELPPRVLRLRMAQVLSKWLGESDKQLDRFFDEIDQLADRPFRTPDGKEYVLPLLVIGEECDGLAHSRGDEAVYDRIQTTLYQRLDTTSQKVKNKLVVFLFTTNVPHLVDPAFLRRAGGTIERFGRLNKKSFVAVLSKHLRDLPFWCEAGLEQTEARRRAVQEVAAWLYSPNGPDRGQAELTFVGSTTPVVKYRRDFLTGALVDRAVQQTAAEACRAERRGTDRPGLTTALLLRAFDEQVRNIVEQLHRDNAANYLTLPDGARVGTVRRLESAAVLPLELERAS